MLKEKGIFGFSEMAKEFGYQTLHLSEDNVAYTSEEGCLNLIARSKVNSSIWYYLYLGDGFDFAANWVRLCKKGPENLMFDEEMQGNPVSDDQNAFMSFDELKGSSLYSDLESEVTGMLVLMENMNNKSLSEIEKESALNHWNYMETAEEVVLAYIEEVENV